MRGASAKTVTLEFTEHFHARGMRRLHGCDVYIGARRRKFPCGIWGAKDGRMLVRFHCPTESDYDESFQVIGLSLSDPSQVDLSRREMDHELWPAWVPQCIRDRWDLWFTSLS
jgi:hypothetical protein